MFLEIPMLELSSSKFVYLLDIFFGWKTMKRFEAFYIWISHKSVESSCWWYRPSSVIMLLLFGGCPPLILISRMMIIMHMCVLKKDVVVVVGSIISVDPPPVSGNGDDFSFFRRRKISICYMPAAGEKLGNCTCFCSSLYVAWQCLLKKSIPQQKIGFYV